MLGFGLSAYAKAFVTLFVLGAILFEAVLTAGGVLTAASGALGALALHTAVLVAVAVYAAVAAGLCLWMHT